MAYTIDGKYISDSEIYDAVKREESRRNKEKLIIEKERQEIFDNLTYELKRSEIEYIKKNIDEYDLLQRYMGIKGNYEESIKSAIKFCKSNPDIIERNFGHYNDILTNEEKMILSFQMVDEWFKIIP